MNRTTPQHIKAPCGQSISEYVLAALLVAVVAIPALSAITLQAGGALPALLDRIFGDGTQTASSSGNTANSGTSGTNPGEGAATAGSPGSVVLDLGNGQSITLQDYPHELGKSIETAGANGTTRRMMASLESMIRQLEEAGEIDAKQAGLLEALANEGHRLANLEAEAERRVDEAARTGNLTPVTETFEFDGQTYWNIGTLANAVGDSVQTADGDWVPGPAMQAFLDEYDKARAGGALENPVMSAFVEQMVHEIWVLGDQFEDRLHEVFKGNTAPENFRQSLADTSAITHLDSAGICESGGGTDSGIHCGG